MKPTAHSPGRRRGLLLPLALLGNTFAAAPRARPGPDGAAREQRSREWFTDTVLVDQDGQRHRFYSDLLAPASARVVLLHPLFTTCSSACPLMVQKLLQLRAALAPLRRDALWILSVSVDPLNDAPDRLKAFASKQGADIAQWRFLGGELADVERVTRRLGLWTDTPDAHQTTLIAGRAAAGHWAKLRPDLAPQALAQQLDRFWAPAAQR